MYKYSIHNFMITIMQWYKQQLSQYFKERSTYFDQHIPFWYQIEGASFNCGTGT